MYTVRCNDIWFELVHKTARLSQIYQAELVTDILDHFEISQAVLIIYQMSPRTYTVTGI